MPQKQSKKRVVKTFLHLGVANAYKDSVHTKKSPEQSKTLVKHQTQNDQLNIRLT